MNTEKAWVVRLFVHGVAFRQRTAKMHSFDISTHTDDGTPFSWDKVGGAEKNAIAAKIHAMRTVGRAHVTARPAEVVTYGEGVQVIRCLLFDPRTSEKSVDPITGAING